MPERICYVHVGTGKTGTSAIQYALTSASDYLAERGFLYPDLSGDFEKVLRGEPTAGNARVVTKALKREEERVKQVVAMLEPYSKGPENLILSCEGLSNLSLPRLEDLVRSLRALGYASRCLVCFRPQAEVMVSLFLQQIKTSRLRGLTLEEYVEEQLVLERQRQRWNWYARADKLEGAFGDRSVSVKWYPALARMGEHGVVSAAFEWIGVTLPPDQSLAYSRKVNPTPGREALTVLESLKSEGIGGRVFSDIFLLRAQQENLLGSKVVMERALLKRVNAATHDSNLKLLGHYFPELNAHEELDGRSNDEQRKTLDARTIERLKEIAADILSIHDRVLLTIKESAGGGPAPAGKRRRRLQRRSAGGPS